MLNKALKHNNVIVHAGFNGLRAFEARKKSWCKMIENRLVIPAPHLTLNITSSPCCPFPKTLY